MASIDISVLTTQERLDLIGRLWDSLDAAATPPTPAQAAELDRRLALGDSAGKHPWPEVYAELTARR